MRSPVRPIDPPRKSRVVIGELASRLRHHLNVGVVEAPAGTDSVEEDSYFQARFGAFAEGIAELSTHLVGMQDVSSEVDGFFCGPDGRKHRRKIFVAVSQQLDFVAGDRNWIGERQGGAKKFRVPNGKSMLEMILERVPSDKKEAKNEDDNEEAERKSDPLGDGEAPPRLMKPVRRIRASFCHRRWDSTLNRVRPVERPDALGTRQRGASVPPLPRSLPRS